MKELMKYEEFTQAVVENVGKYLPLKYGDAQIVIKDVVKNNGEYRKGLIIRKENEMVSPTIYLEEFFMDYKKGASFDEVMKKISRIRIEKAPDDGIDYEAFGNFESCRQKIYPRLINLEWNESFLIDKPYVKIADLAVTFYLNVGERKDGILSCQVNNSILNLWDVTVEELYEIAISNIERNQCASLTSLDDVIRKMLSGEVKEEVGDAPCAGGIYVLTNSSSIHGASVVLSDAVMKRVIEKLGDELYIIPSSIHELLVLPSCQGEAEALSALVREVNSSTVDVVDRLSDHVYRYTLKNGLEVA